MILACKSKKIGASGGAAQAAEAGGDFFRCRRFALESLRFSPKAELRAARALAKILAKITKVTEVIDLGKLKTTKVIKVYRQAQKL